MPSPLDGIRVIDLTHVWAGPLGTRILADLGADVIKVEARTGRGPATIPKGAAGMWQGKPDDEPFNHQALFNKLNRNKRSVCLDLKNASGRQALLDLVAESDVIIENFSARAMRSLRLDYAELIKVNSAIIYVAMPGYGTYGPLSDYVAFGPSVELMTGLTTLLGYGEDDPRTTSMALPDAVSGVSAAAAVVSALRRRRQSGRGVLVDLALHESAICMLGEYLVRAQRSAEPESIRGNRDAGHAPQGIYPCATTGADNDYIFIGCRNDDEWRALGRLTQQARLLDTRFDDVEMRLRHHDEIDSLLSGFTAQFDKLQLMETLQFHGIPAGAVMVAPEFMQDPQVVERRYFVTLGDRPVSPLPFPGSPVTIDGERHAGFRPAPRLGEHNDEVLRTVLGYDDEQIDELYKMGVLASRPPEQNL